MGKQGLQLLLGDLLGLDDLCGLLVDIATATSEDCYEFVEEGGEAFLEDRQQCLSFVVYCQQFQ